MARNLLLAFLHTCVDLRAALLLLLPLPLLTQGKLLSGKGLTGRPLPVPALLSMHFAQLNASHME